MFRWNRWRAAGAVAVLFVAAGSAWAETVELVTYYPASTTTGDLHARSLTVGTPYASQTPADGVAFIFDQLGIGPGFTAAAPPTEALEAVGNILTASLEASALFKANRGVNTIPNGLQVLTNRVPQWTIGTRVGSEGLHLFSSADDATRLFIEQATGNVGIGTAAPTAAPSPANGSATGNIDANDVWLRSANRWASQGGSGPTFITPVALFSGISDSGWKNMNVSDRVPEGAKAIIVWVVCANTGGAVTYVQLEVSLSSALPSSQYVAWLSTNDKQEVGTQAMIPIDSNREFEYSLEISGQGSIDVTLVGYYT